MKIFTYARTLWYEFWTHYWAGAPSKEEVACEPIEPEIILSAKEKYETQTPITAQVRPSPELSRQMTNAYKHRFAYDSGSFCSQSLVRPTKKIWVYNVSRIDHTVDNPMLGTVTIPGNTTRKRYSLWTSFPDVIINLQAPLDTDDLIMCPARGDLFVMDLLNPDNLGVNQAEKPRWSTSIGRDLTVKGVFWSYNNPPLRQEVTQAVKRMETRYTALLEQLGTQIITGLESYETKVMKFYDYHISKGLLRVRAFEEANEDACREYNITPEHHAAAEHFKITTVWHPVLYGNKLAPSTSKVSRA